MKLIRDIALFVILMSAWAARAQTSWTGALNTDWNRAGNWTAGVPTATLDAIIGDANFTGASQPTITAKSSCKSLTLGTGVKASTLTVNHALSVSGDITIGANGTLNHSTSQAITLRGNWNNTGSYVVNQNHATVSFSGTTQTLSGVTTFRRLNINAGSTTTLNANISVSNQLQVSGTVDPGDSPTFAVSGNAKLVVKAGGTLRVKAATFAGNYPLSGAKNLAAGSIVDYASAALNQTVANNLTYSTLRISGGLTKTLAGNLPVLNGSTAASGNILVVAGTLDLSSFSADRGTGGGTTTGGSVSVANDATLKIGGTRTFPLNYATHTLGVTSTVEYSGTAQTVTRESYGNLTLSSSGGAAVKTMPISAMTVSGNLTSSLGAGTSTSFTAGQNVTVIGNVSIGASTIFNGSSFAHTFARNWTNNGTYAGGTGSVTFSGPNAVISGTGTNNFNNLTVTGTGVTAAANSNLGVSGNLVVTGAGTFIHTAGGSGTLTMSGAGKTISGTGFTFNHLTASGSISTTNSFTIAGNFSVGGTFSAAGGTITMTGPAAVISGAGALTFTALNVRGTVTTARNFSIRSDLSVPGSFTATAGTASFIGTSLLSGTANLFNVTLNGTRLQLFSGSILGIAGSFAVTAGAFDAATTTPNTVNYNAASAQAVLPLTYDHLTFSGSGNRTASAAVAVLGNLTIGAGTTFNAGSFTHSLYGDWINQGSFAAGTGTIQLLGLSTEMTGATTFNVLTLNKTSAGDSVHLNSSIGVGTLNMTSGRMLTDASSVTITTTRTGPGIILGTITRTHAFSAGTPYAFESPANTVDFTTLGGVSSVTVAVTVGPISDFPYGSAINREYDVSLLASGPYEATLRLHYEDTELNGNLESAVQLLHFDPPWTIAGVTGRDTTANWAEEAGLADITGRWSVSDNPKIVAWNGSVSTAWETAGNWTVLAGSGSTPPGTNEIVALGITNFLHHPTISTPVQVRSLSFGSAQPLTLTVASGGSLTNNGNISGEWTNNAVHSIVVGAQSLTVAGDLQMSDGTNGHAINLSVGSGSASVAGTLTQSGGASLAITAAGNLAIGADFIYSSGSFSPDSGTVTYNGSAAQAVAGGITYHNLSFDKPAGTATATNTLVVGGSLVLSNASSFVVKAPLVVSNDVVIHTNTTLNGDSATLTVAGNWINQGAFAPESGTVMFVGTNSQSIAATTFNHLTINKSASVATLTGNLVIDGNLDVSAGTLDLSVYTANRGAVGGTNNLAANTTLRIGTGSSFPDHFDTVTLAPSSVVEYYGTGSQVVADKTYGNLRLSNGGATAKTLAGNATVASDLLINSGATFDAGAFGLVVNGHWTNNGAFTASASSVTLGGSAKNLSGATTFHDLTVAGGYSGLSDITVNGSMTVSGSYSAGGTTCTLAGDLVNSGTLSSSGMVIFTGTAPQSLALNSGFVSTGTAEFNGSVAPTLLSASSPTFQNVQINNLGGVVPNIGWLIHGDFSVAAGALFDGGSATHTFEGNFANAGIVNSSGVMSFNPGSAVTLTLGGSAFSSQLAVFGGSGLIAFGPGAQPFGSVGVLNTHSAGVTPAAAWTLSGDLFIGPGATFNGGAGLSSTVGGDFSDDGVFNGGTSQVTLNATADPVNGASIAGIGSTTFHNLTVAGTALVAADADFSVDGNFTNNGLFDGTGSIVTFTGSGPSVLGGSTTPTPFDSLVVAKTAATTALAVDLSGLTSLTVSGGTLDVSAFAVGQNAIGGVLGVAGGATLRVGGASTLPVFDTYALDAAGTVEYYGSASQTISAVNYGNLVSTSTGARVLPSGGIIGIAGSFVPGANAYTVAGSTVNYNGASGQTVVPFNYFNLTNGSAAARVLGTNGTIGVAGSFSPGAGAYTVDGSTINFNGASQTVPAFTYHNLVSSGSGTKTLAGDITVNGSLTLSSGTLNDAGFITSVKGGADNEATHAGTGAILLTGGSAAHVLSGPGVYQNLSLDDALGATLSLTNLTVNGTLTFTSGNIVTTTNKVIIGSAGLVARTSGHVVGALQKSVATATARTNTFEIGDAANYAPVSVIFTNITTAGNLTAFTTPGEHPDIANSGIAATRDVSRFWTLTNNGTVFAQYSALFNFSAGDTDLAANPTNFIVAKRSGGTWTHPLIVSRTDTNILARGMTNFSDFVVGESAVAPPTITAQPQSQTVNLGATAQFSVTATGSGTLTYQWLFKGNPIGGATGTTLTVTNAQTSDAGTYSVVVDNGSQVTSDGAVLTVNQPPTLAAILDQAVNELATLTVASSATDPENATLTYQLTQAPAGASVDASGVVSWTPTEAQGPSTNTFTLQVADNGTPPLTDSKSFTVMVAEVNAAPVLTVPADQTIAEQTTLSVSASATDADLPANTLTFALLNPPSGMTINSASGAISWTPSESQGPSTNVITVTVTDNGSPSLSATNTFTVKVTEVNVAPVLTVPADQTVAEQTTLSVSASATDADLPANTLTFALLNPPSGMTINSASGAISWTPSESQGPSTNVITVTVTDNGSPSLSATNTFTVKVTEVNVAPVLTVPADQTIAEQTALSVSASATDADLPANTLTFALLNPPSGMTINGASGAISWTPSESQGPSTNVITVTVTDNGSPSLSATNTFTVKVTEVNVAPVLTVPADQTIAEQTTLSVSASATDADLPANTLTFALLNPPSGMTINSASGAISWTPSESQGPSTNVITVTVTDNGSPSLSATNTFTVKVTEVNVAPVLTVPADQTIAEQTTLSVSASATDADLPANTLTFALLNPPSGMTINSASGAISWTPTESQGQTTNVITVTVTDNGNPSRSATNTFTVKVTEANTAPVLTVPADHVIREIVDTLSVNLTAADSDLPANTLTFSLVSAPTGMNLNPATGALTWAPTEEQGPSTNVITVRVTDNGTPALSDTKNFTVIVTELNSVPALVVPSNQTTPALSTLVVTNVAFDPDIPANTLTFSLVSGPAGANIDPGTGVLTWTPAQADAGTTNLITVKVSDNGVPPLSSSRSFSVVVTNPNTALVLVVPTGDPANRTIREVVDTLVVTNTVNATAPALAPFTYSLAVAPAGMSVNSATGVLTWTPTEEQGPSTNLVVVRVTDSGSPALSDTKSFTVIVTELNSVPALVVPSNQTTPALSTLVVTNVAFDPDIPANTLTFSLVSGPAGANIDPATGVLTWTPTQADAGTTNLITVKVSDDGVPPLSASGTFSVVVANPNTALVLVVPTGDPANRTIREIVDTLVVTNTVNATAPALAPFTYSLAVAPAGMIINSGTGVLTWTPTEAQGPSTNLIVVRVTDSGSPALTDTKSFTVIVTELNSVPALVVPSDRVIDELVTLVVTNQAFDSDIPANTLTFSLTAGPAGANLDPATGVLTWTPAEDQGGTTNVFTVRVTDNGTPTLSASRSFTVVVKDVNVAPVLPIIANRTNDIGTTVTFTVTATDSDLPANTLTYSLTSAPAGATIDSNTGVFSWTIPGPNTSTNNFTVMVADNGTPALSATRTFTIVGRITTEPAIIGIVIIGNDGTITFSGIPGEVYRVEAADSLNPPIQWSTVSTNVAATNGLFQYVEQGLKNRPMRFFRAANP